MALSWVDRKKMVVPMAAKKDLPRADWKAAMTS